MNFNGDPNLGLYGFATDRFCLVGCDLTNKIKSLDVPIFTTTMLSTEFVGIFSAGNSSGVVVPDIIETHELNHLKTVLSKIGVSVLVLESRFTALGNLILMNDNGIILSELLKENKKEIEEFFGLDCTVSTLAGLDIVGSLGIATNNGCLLAPQSRKKEIKTVEKYLGVEADIGTVNFGSPFPKSGLIVNKNGYVVSPLSSGPELQRIEEVFGFIKR